MIVENFLKALNLDEEGARTLVKAIFLANLMADDLEGDDLGSVPDQLDASIVQIIGAAAESKLFGSSDMEEVLTVLNEDEELENLYTAQRNKIFWEELVSHKVGKQMEVRGIDLDDSVTIEKLFEEMEDEVEKKGAENF